MIGFPIGLAYHGYPMRHPVSNEDREEDDWQFFAEAIKAWRAWRVIDYDGVLVLRSITYQTNWLPRQEMIAQCVPDSLSLEKAQTSHAAPDLEHGCGIYSLKNREDALTWSEFSGKLGTTVYGTVSIWGHAFKFTKGYISEFAYPSSLFVKQIGEDLSGNVDSKELAMILAETYRIEAVPE